MQLAADIDDIPAIFASDNLFIDVEDGNREWDQEELVIGLKINGDSRAYPVRLLSSHEIVNDTVGGQPVAVTWCPLCYSTIVFNRIVDDRELTFGVSGYLYRNNLVMYDHQTDTFWSQLLAQGMRGAMRGQYLETLPSIITSWGEWQQAHPQTTILSAEKLGKSADTIIDPYAGYYTSGSAGIMGVEAADTRLPPKSLVIGLQVGSITRAYPLENVQQERIIHDELNELPILLAYDESLQTVLVYKTTVDGERLSFIRSDEPGFLQDEQTASIWDIKTGTAMGGKFKGQQLPRLVSPLVFWFAWVDIHPDTELYTTP
jgi:hypothetical protein